MKKITPFLYLTLAAFAAVALYCAIPPQAFAEQPSSLTTASAATTLSPLSPTTSSDASPQIPNSIASSPASAPIPKKSCASMWLPEATAHR